MVDEEAALAVIGERQFSHEEHACRFVEVIDLFDSLPLGCNRKAEHKRDACKRFAKVHFLPLWDSTRSEGRFSS